MLMGIILYLPMLFGAAVSNIRSYSGFAMLCRPRGVRLFIDAVFDHGVQSSDADVRKTSKPARNPALGSAVLLALWLFRKLGAVA